MASSMWPVLQLPSVYLVLLTMSLSAVWSLYTICQAFEFVSKSWFPSHLQRDVFLSLRCMEEAPQSLLRAALLRRAAEGVRRALVLRNARQVCEVLLRRESIGAGVSKQLDHAEKEVNNELRAVVTEARVLAPNDDWVRTIFQSANEVVANEALRGRLQDIEGKQVEECEWWEKRQATIIDELLQEFGPEIVAGMKRHAGGTGERVGLKKKRKKGKMVEKRSDA